MRNRRAGEEEKDGGSVCGQPCEEVKAKMFLRFLKRKWALINTHTHSHEQTELGKTEKWEWPGRVRVDCPSRSVWSPSFYIYFPCAFCLMCHSCDLLSFFCRVSFCLITSLLFASLNISLSFLHACMLCYSISQASAFIRSPVGTQKELFHGKDSSKRCFILAIRPFVLPCLLLCKVKVQEVFVQTDFVHVNIF